MDWLVNTDNIAFGMEISIHGKALMVAASFNNE